MRFHLLTATMAAAGLALAGCGDDDSSSATSGTPQEQIKATVKNLAVGSRDDDQDKVCDQLSTKSKAQITTQVAPQVNAKGKSCPEILTAVQKRSPTDKKQIPTDDEIDASKITVTGATAKAAVKGEKGPIPLVREQGRWLIAPG